MIIKKSILFLLGTFVYSGMLIAQDGTSVDQINGRSDEYNVITTAVPFLTIAPDSRAGAMGDAGVATTTDTWSMHWNPAKYAFGEKKVSAGISYTPWLRSLGINDINLFYAAGYYKLNKMQSLAASLLFFSLGDITFTNDQGEEIPNTHTPNEWALDLAYSRKLTDHFALSVAGRFIYSNLIGEFEPDSKPGTSIAADISGFYTNKVTMFGYKNTVNLGFDITNIGQKISYTDGGEKNFLPTNLRLGGGLIAGIDKYNEIGLFLDLNKLLVPSEDASSNVSTVSGIFQSFTDAPGGGTEELHEITYSIGAEYWYDKQFSVRTGFFYEHETKGDRKFFSLGLGMRLNVFGLDVSYLVPFNSNSPLANTLRFSLTFNFNELKEESKPVETVN